MQQALSWAFSRKAKRGLAALGLAVFLLLLAMVTFPGLHALFHRDASEPDHECAVTLFVHGQVHCADAVVPVLRPEPLPIFIQSLRAAVFVSTDVRLLPGRGPPSLPSLPV
jgi:hypothetical protein